MMKNLRVASMTLVTGKLDSKHPNNLTVRTKIEKTADTMIFGVKNG